MLPARRGQVLALFLGWWSHYDTTRLLNVPSPPMFSFTGIYKSCGDEKVPVDMMLRMENVSITMPIFAAYRNGN